MNQRCPRAIQCPSRFLEIHVPRLALHRTSLPFLSFSPRRAATYKQYFVEGMLGTAVANAPVECGAEEFVRVTPPADYTCERYLSEYLSEAGGYLLDGSSTTQCQFCALDNTNTFLENFSIKYSNRWRNFGIIWVYIGVNAAAAFGLYWLARVVSLPELQ